VRPAGPTISLLRNRIQKAAIMRTLTSLEARSVAGGRKTAGVQSALTSTVTSSTPSTNYAYGYAYAYNGTSMASSLSVSLTTSYGYSYSYSYSYVYNGPGSNYH
jgi:hypothetical protein